MAHGTADRIAFDVTAQTALRVLIASYFLAVALELIPGTNLAVLFSSVLPAPFDSATAAGLVFILSFMVMIGYATRAAALVIAIMTFFASYLTMVNLGVQNELGSFWRDLALIAALLLTYSEPLAGSRRRRRILHRHVTPRRIADSVALSPAEARPARAEVPALAAEIIETDSEADAETPSAPVYFLRARRPVTPRRVALASDARARLRSERAAAGIAAGPDGVWAA